MIYKTIYQTALALLGMRADTPGVGDFEERAPVLLSMLTHRFARYSEQLGSWAAETLAVTSLDDEFVLDPRLYAVISHELAAALILDELPELAKTQRELAKAELSRVLDEAVRTSPTREVHGV